jgi:hypothetical protein
MPRFQPGQSGNPGGRPKENRIVRELARKHTDDAIAVLAEIMHDVTKHESARITAAVALLDRGWGKPAQAIVGGDEDDAPIQLAEILIRAVDAAGDRSTS